MQDVPVNSEAGLARQPGIWVMAACQYARSGLCALLEEAGRPVVSLGVPQAGTRIRGARPLRMTPEDTVVVVVPDPPALMLQTLWYLTVTLRSGRDGMPGVLLLCDYPGDWLSHTLHRLLRRMPVTGGVRLLPYRTRGPALLRALASGQGGRRLQVVTASPMPGLSWRELEVVLDYHCGVSVAAQARAAGRSPTTLHNQCLAGLRKLDAVLSPRRGQRRRRRAGPGEPARQDARVTP